MKKYLSLFVLTFVFALSGAAFGQEKMEKKPTDKDKTEAIPANGVLKRGAMLGKSKKVSLAKVMANPAKYTGKMVRVEGVIVRSCKMEGCWLELAPIERRQIGSREDERPRLFYPARLGGRGGKSRGCFYGQDFDERNGQTS